MNDSELRELADAVGQVLRPHLERSKPLRRTVALIGQWLCEEASRAGDATTDRTPPVTREQTPMVAAAAASASDPSTASRSTPSGSDTEPPSPAPQSALPMASAMVPLKLGNAVVHLPLTGTTEELGRARHAAIEPMAQPRIAATRFLGDDKLDLTLCEQRCRLKAASCRLFIERRAGGEDSGAEERIQRRWSEMLEHAKTMPDCFLWVFWSRRKQPDNATLSMIAETYDALADAIALMRGIDEPGDAPSSNDRVSALHLLAEANSALRAALAETWLERDDHDQVKVHIWLRQETAARRVVIGRHMTADDPADPSQVADLRKRIRHLGDRLGELALRAKDIKVALSLIKNHADQVVGNDSVASPAHWEGIARAVAELAMMGVAATDRRIAEAVGSQAAALCPAELRSFPGLASVVARASTLATSSCAAFPAESSRDAEGWSESVLEARTLLRGRRMVIIGGEPKADAIERLNRAFRLREVEWVPLTEHGPAGPMRAPIHKSGTAVVVVIVKLTGHLHADRAKEYAAAAGTPCILLTGGYNPERVARAILDQASARLNSPS